MQITERQEDILNKIIQEYINSAFPVSSQSLESRYHFGISTATIRNEMQKLSDRGLLSQPYLSAGRVPTDKGYRFFVDGLLEKGISDNYFKFKIEDDVDVESLDSVKLVQLITKNLSRISSNLVISYLAEDKIFWKEGWEEILEEPEFQERQLISDLTKLIKNFEEGIESFNFDSDFEIYIGKENPFLKIKDFTIICAKCYLPENKEGIISILGPKRMKYGKNISLINSLKKFFLSW